MTARRVFLVKAKRRKLIVVALFMLLCVTLYARFSEIFSTQALVHHLCSNQSSAVIPRCNGDQVPLKYVLQNLTPYSSSNLGKILALQYPFLMDTIINNDNFKRVITPRVTCSGRDVYLAICVAGRRDNYVARSIIRDTWGSYARDPVNKAVLVFFIGSQSDTNTTTWGAKQLQIQNEASLFGDIFQEDYMDTYRNLTLKSVSILKWVTSFCSSARFVLKVDDDMYINVPFLLKILQEFISTNSLPSAFILGKSNFNSKPMRNLTSKWYTSLSEFNESIYPNYVSGTAYLMSNHAAFLLYEASLREPRFWLEDVYVTGLCARKAKVQLFKSKYFAEKKFKQSGCALRYMVSGHGYTSEDIIKIHKELYDPNISC